MQGGPLDREQLRLSRWTDSALWPLDSAAAASLRVSLPAMASTRGCDSRTRWPSTHHLTRHVWLYGRTSLTFRSCGSPMEAPTPASHPIRCRAMRGTSSRLASRV